MKIRINKAPKGMPVQSWAILSPHGPAVGGFVSAEAAEAWAQEWAYSHDTTIIAPVCSVADATAALLRYEQHVQGLEEGEEWKQG